MVRYSNHEALEGEAPDRWDGVNHDPPGKTQKDP